MLKVITIFSPLRIFAPIGAAAFMLGAGYGAWNFAYHDRIPNGAVLLLMFSVIVIMVILTTLLTPPILTVLLRRQAARN